jgi:hypothetical protein
VCYGTTLSSESTYHPSIVCADCKLRLEEGDWTRWTKEPGRYMLHELAPTVAILHELLQKGTPHPPLYVTC